MTEPDDPTELQRMTAAGWSPELRKIVRQQCLLGQAQSVAAGRPGEARRLGKIMDMLAELDADDAGETLTSDEPLPATLSLADALKASLVAAAARRGAADGGEPRA